MDNSGDPTFWSHCADCEKFYWGINPLIHQIAKELVVNKGYIHYNHMDLPESREDWYKKYYERTQISGTCGIVQMVLNAKEKIEKTSQQTYNQ